MTVRRTEIVQVRVQRVEENIVVVVVGINVPAKAVNLTLKEVLAIEPDVLLQTPALGPIG